MGIFVGDIPIDTSGANADRWLFALSEKFNGPLGHAVFEDGRTVEPVDGRVLRRFAAGMGHALVGAMRVAGGEPMELGDCSSLKPGPSEAEIAAKAKAEADAKAAAAAKAEADEYARLEAEIAAEEAPAPKGGKRK